MRVLVDTTIWSLALRRRRHQLSADEQALVGEWADLVREGRVVLAGAIRQEVLSGIATAAAFEKVRDALRPFHDVPVTTADHENAARAFNVCGGRGITASSIDMLLCAVALRLDASVFTIDDDFGRYAGPLGLTLHERR